MLLTLFHDGAVMRQNAFFLIQTFFYTKLKEETVQSGLSMTPTGIY